MRSISLGLAGLLLTLTHPIACRAQEPAAPPTLAAALAVAAPPVNGLALAVAADKVTLPQDYLPPPGATVPAAAAAFGWITQDFDDVTAVAPPTIPVLNPDPHDPNIYDGMKPRDVLTLLVASLDETQWAALTGKGGLGMDDLTSVDQHQLFAALFPGGKLMIRHAPTNTDYVQAYVTAAASGLSPEQAGKQIQTQFEASGRDVSDELPQVRLRLGHRIFISMNDGDQPGHSGYAFGSDDPAAPPHWEAMNDDQYKPKDRLYGASVRVDMPNALKDGQLDFDSAALDAPVAVTTCKTVEELVAAVAQAAHIELYVDKRWEAKPLTIVGTNQAQSARNLLRALAVCLGGTYRKVGPAYILTYDMVGVGTIRQRWAEFDSDAEAIKRMPLTDARIHISALHALADLTQTDDPLEPTADQRKIGDPSRGRTTLTFAQLTSGQQGFVRRYITQQQTWHDREQVFIHQYPKYKDGFPFDTDVPTTQGQIKFIITPQLQLLLPSVQEPIDSSVLLFRSNLFASVPKPLTVLNPRQPIAPALKAVPLPLVLAAIPRRAVLAHPRTLADVDALIPLLQHAKMNALYLDVFSNGISHLGDSPDILDEALTKTRGTGIAVFPTMDLFGWSEKAPVAAPDLNILGETSAQAARRQQARTALYMPPTPTASPTPLFVSPTAPATQQTLLALVQNVSARPGIAGLIWHEATPPGYALNSGMDSTELGYTEADRLAFLRRAHVDPVDVSFPNSSGANLSLPAYDGNDADTALQSQWQAARVQEQRTLLQLLFTAAQPWTVFVERTGRLNGDDWYGSWENPKAPLPAFHYAWEIPESGPTDRTASADAQAKSQSRLALLASSPEWLLGPGAGAYLQAKVQHSHWDGFVLDADAPRPDEKKAPLSLAATLAEIGAGLISNPPSPSASPRPSVPPP